MVANPAPHPLRIFQLITQRHLYGAERMCIALSEALSARGHQVLLVCKPGDMMVREALDRGVAVRPAPIGGKLRPTSPLKIAALVDEFRPDVIHTHLSTAALWGTIVGRMKGIPVVAHVHALNRKRFYSAADMMVTCSGGVRAHLIAQGVPPARAKVVYNGIDMRRFEKIAAQDVVRASLGIPGEAPVVTCVAHLSARKGQDILLRAIALLQDRWPQLQCLLLGDGKQLRALRALADELGVAQRVQLLGYRKDAISIMNASDILVLPSVAKEGLGLVLVEAALLGKPTVGSDAPGINEALADKETGLLFPPGNAPALADRLETLLTSPALRARMGAAGRERALSVFTVERMAQQTENVYYELLDHRLP